MGLILLIATAPLKADMNPLDAMITPGDLIKGHAKFEHECKTCHKAFKRGGQNELCLSCHDHKDIAKDVNSKTGYHGRVADHACSDCHTEHKGRKAKIVQLNAKTFNHKWTDFPLTGAHSGSKIKCVDCHPRGKPFRSAPTDC